MYASQLVYNQNEKYPNKRTLTSLQHAGQWHLPGTVLCQDIRMSSTCLHACPIFHKAWNTV